MNSSKYLSYIFSLHRNLWDWFLMISKFSRDKCLKKLFKKELREYSFSLKLIILSLTLILIFPCFSNVILLFLSCSKTEIAFLSIISFSKNWLHIFWKYSGIWLYLYVSNILFSSSNITFTKLNEKYLRNSIIFSFCFLKYY